MNRVLVPLDGSAFSAQILDAVKKVFAPNATQLILYHVGAVPDGYTGLPPRPAAVGVDVPMYETGQDAELAHHPIYESQEEDSRLAALQDQLEPLARSLRDVGYSVHVEADLGGAADVIVQRAQQGDVDVIAMTTHGRSGILRLLFGSVAEQVVRHVSVPVLLLRPTTETESARDT